MVVVNDSTNLFNSEEKAILEKKCISFTNTDIPTTDNDVLVLQNYYIRERFNNNDIEFETIISKINDYVFKLLKTNKIGLDGFWINKITNETNKNDDFHTDFADITFLMYLNDTFTGGEYEYNEPNIQGRKKIKPKKYLSIVTSTDIEHRVKPVIEGERYSIVFFYSFDKKVNKTLI